jgi:tRNA (guanine37-N1)-methyltransferase
VKVEIVTLFPGYFDSIFDQSIMRRAQDAGLLEIVVHNLRDYATGKHQPADDYRFGGGPGMLMKPDPFYRVMEKLFTDAPRRPLVIYPSAQGKPFKQADAIKLSRVPHAIFLCGHYKGIDQRVIERWVDWEVSLGDYVITGGEPAAAVMIDAAARLIPGALGDFDSARGDSFYDELLDAQHYTRPEDLEGRGIPGVLMTGHHKNIEHWRHAVSKYLTGKRRPDLDR